MRVTNNLFVFNNNRNIQQDSIQRKPYYTPMLGRDMVNFTGGIRVTRKEPVFDLLNQLTQDTMGSIYLNLKKAKKYFADMHPVKVTQIKQKYEPLQIYKGSKGHTFKLTDNPDGIDTISVYRSNKNENLMRIVVKDKKENATHFVIDGLDRVVANISQNQPYLMPPRLRYMTNAQINQSGVKKYIALADEELGKYVKFLDEFGQAKPVEKVAEKPVKKVAEEVKPPIESQVAVKPVKIKPDNLFAIFDNTAETLPKHINPQISPASGKVVGFSLKTQDGGSLKVSKKMNSLYGDQLRYVSLEKTLPNGEKKYISIDLSNKNFLDTDQNTGKPTIFEDSIYSFTPEEIEKNNLANDFAEYMKEIFRKTKSGEENLTQEVTVLKIKQNKPQPKSVAIQSLEDIEDPNLNRILDEEMKRDKLSSKEQPTVKKRGRKLKNAKVEAQTAEVVVTPKRRGRKPKSENVEPMKTPKTEEPRLNYDIEKYKNEIIAKANEEADNFAELYFKTFVSRFKETLGQKIADFKTKYEELFNI